MGAPISVGNQLPILLIDFITMRFMIALSWESVTDPLDRLRPEAQDRETVLGISYRSS